MKQNIAICVFVALCVVAISDAAPRSKGAYLPKQSSSGGGGGNAKTLELEITKLPCQEIKTGHSKDTDGQTVYNFKFVPCDGPSGGSSGGGNGARGGSSGGAAGGGGGARGGSKGYLPRGRSH